MEKIRDLFKGAKSWVQRLFAGATDTLTDAPHTGPNPRRRRRKTIARPPASYFTRRLTKSRKKSFAEVWPNLSAVDRKKWAKGSRKFKVGCSSESSD